MITSQGGGSGKIIYSVIFGLICVFFAKLPLIYFKIIGQEGGGKPNYHRLDDWISGGGGGV